MSNECEWKKIYDEDAIEGIWDLYWVTKCGNEIEEYDKLSNFVFCPYCGKKIKEVLKV